MSAGALRGRKGGVATSTALFLAACMAVWLSGCSSSAGGKGGAAPPGRNPIGLMLGGEGMGVPLRMNVAQELGAPHFRPSDVTIEGWRGQDQELEAFQAAGFKLVLTVRNGGQGGPSPTPASPPRDLEKYRQGLAQILDRYPPELLAVENEESSVLYYSGTPEQYGAELVAACETAHARGIKCTNGGLASDLVVALVWDDYRSRGKQAEAEDFLQRAATSQQLDMAKTEEGRARMEYSVKLGKRLLEQYRASGIDYVNFHWYVADAQALEEAVSCLKTATGLQPLSNEMGQRDKDPATVDALLQASLELRLPYVVWFSEDRGEAKALQDPDGTLRPNGQAFQAFIRDTFRGVPAP